MTHSNTLIVRKNHLNTHSSVIVCVAYVSFLYTFKERQDRIIADLQLKLLMRKQKMVEVKSSVKTFKVISRIFFWGGGGLYFILK